jgi:hypothetical protein
MSMALVSSEVSKRLTDEVNEDKRDMHDNLAGTCV